MNSKKLDVLLINPGNRRAVYQGLGADYSAIEPPSLAAMFATYLRRRGQSVEMIDAAAENLDYGEVADLAVATAPVLIVLVVYGFQPSASTQNMTAAGEIAKAIKWCNPNAKIMMTGTHPAALPGRTLAECDIDFVCSGEGPRTITQTVLYLKAGRAMDMGVPDLHYWHGGKKVPGALAMRTPSGELMDNLDTEMPGGAWDLLPMHLYRAHNWHALEHIEERSPYVSMHTSLGCPYKCTFCCINAPFGKSSYRMWKPETVVAEIKMLVNVYGVRNIKFVDEMFVLNKAHVIGICDGLIAAGLGEHLNIWAYARVDTVKDEYLDKLQRAGFRWLALGIESASKHVRDGVEKGRFGSEEIIKTVRKVQGSGINVIGNYIFGLPDDTHESMQETLALALEANCEFANFYSAMAYPGSKLYTIAQEKGWKLPDEWIGYSQHSYETEPLPTETLSAAEVLAFRDGAFKIYFTDPFYLGMVRKRFGEKAYDDIRRMAAHWLPRKILETK